MEKICLKLFSLQKIDKNKSFIKKQPPEGFRKKGVLKKFHKIHLKTPVLESYFNSISCLRVVTILKKRLQHRCFQVNFMKFLRTPFLQNTSVICLTVSFHKEVLYICSNLLLLEKWTKLTILLSFHFANTFYTLYYSLYFIDQNINTWNDISSMR